VAYSKQLLFQSSVSIENFLRDDMMKQVAVKLDYLALNGSGSASEPTGILNTPGIGTVLFGGAATYAKVVNFEGLLVQANADVQGARIAWLTSPLVRNTWKALAAALTGGTTTNAKPVWEAGAWNDGSNDGIVNQYRAAVTNNVLNNQVFFGNWEELVIGIFGNGLDITPNPYTRAKEGVIEMTINTYADIALRHAQSFVISSDSGNQ